MVTGTDTGLDARAVPFNGLAGLRPPTAAAAPAACR